MTNIRISFLRQLSRLPMPDRQYAIKRMLGSGYCERRGREATHTHGALMGMFSWSSDSIRGSRHWQKVHDRYERIESGSRIPNPHTES